jgi:tRNA pseudouridine38-40 synthase
VTVNWVRETSEAFHPRFSATARRYLFVYFDGAQNPFAHQFAWAVPPLDADAMHRQAQVLVGEHNFTSFRAAGCQSATAMRRVNRCDVRRLGAYVVLDIEANAFLLHMVRNIARVLMDLGCGRTDMSLETLINNRDRSQVGATAPPHGLYLYHVSYPTESFPQPHVPPILAAAVGPT